MTIPLIGITIHPAQDPDRQELDPLLAAITRGVEQAGGAPLHIPLHLEAPTLRALFDRLDGILFSGGGDVNPARYGATTRHARLGGVDDERDRTELLLGNWVATTRTPFLGICRGAQVLNVALGGTLYQDISEHPGAIQHTFAAKTHARQRPHAVSLASDSQLARLIGAPRLAVNSLHHQAIRTLAPGLRAVATAPDGLVEGVELTSHPFALAIQWHPEALLDAPDMAGLFAGLVQAARASSPA